MHRSTFYRLTMSFWEDAVAAKVEPIQCGQFHFLPNGPQFFRPTELFFAQPPSRADFNFVIRATPYLDTSMDHVREFLKTSHRAIIDAAPWPTLDPCMKSTEQKYHNSQGQWIGRISVEMEQLVGNSWHQSISVGYSDVMKVIGRRTVLKTLTNGAGCTADIYVCCSDHCGNRIREKLNLLCETGHENIEAALNYEIENALFEGGYLAGKRKCRNPDPQEAEVHA